MSQYNRIYQEIKILKSKISDLQSSTKPVFDVDAPNIPIEPRIFKPQKSGVISNGDLFYLFLFLSIPSVVIAFLIMTEYEIFYGFLISATITFIVFINLSSTVSIEYKQKLKKYNLEIEKYNLRKKAYPDLLKKFQEGKKNMRKILRKLINFEKRLLSYCLNYIILISIMNREKRFLTA